MCFLLKYILLSFIDLVYKMPYINENLWSQFPYDKEDIKMNLI